MKDSEVLFDKRYHVLYSKPCKKEILSKIALHYPPEQVEEVFTAVQKQYSDYLKDYRTDLGGKNNFHNGVAGTYDCIALFSYYVVCREKTSLEEVEEMNNNIFLPAFKRMGFVDCNLSFFQWVMHRAFVSSQRKCAKWNDFKMKVEPYKKGEPIRYHFQSCPIAEFAKEHNLLEVLPALCNGDYAAMELIHAKLIRTTTCGNGTMCDYTICGDKDAFCQLHEEYVDEQGYRRNR